MLMSGPNVRLRDVLIAISWFASALGLAVWMSSAASAEQRRKALVIGNANYQHTRALANTRNDASTMAEFFRSTGFDVTEVHDLKYADFRSSLRDFAQASVQAEMAVVYFAGHGLETAGVNYLLPVDARLATSADLEYEAITLNTILELLREQRLLSLIILDACRNNPLAEKMAMQSGAIRSVRRGLGRVEPKGDVLVAYAAAAGTVAHDGVGDNSPFVKALIRHLGAPGIDLRVAFGGVRDAVLAATNNDQEPIIYGALGGRTISLVPPAAGAQASPSAAFREQDAKVAWESVKESCDTSMIRLFATRYKDTFFGDLATKRVSEIENGAACAPKSAARSTEELARRLQDELRRVGCFTGETTGSWGPRSAAAMGQFRQHAKIAISTEPSEEALQSLVSAKGRVCPVTCAAGERVQAGRCVKVVRNDAAVAPNAGSGPMTSPDRPAAVPSAKPVVAAEGCEGVRAACAQLRNQCMKDCRERTADRTYGNCSGCISAFSLCISQGSISACK